MLLKKEEETKKFRHDNRARLRKINQLLQDNKLTELKKYLDGITGLMKEINTPFITGNDMVNAILYDMTVTFEEIKFIIEWIGILPENLKILDIDLDGIFSNVLSNAIESIEKFHSEEVMKISVEITREKGNLMIEIKNPCLKPVAIKKNNIKTEKLDSSLHGYGTRIIKECVEKYDGSLNYNYSENEFVTEIIFHDILVE